VTYLHDQNQETFGVDFVNYAIVPDANPPGVSTGELLGPGGPRVIHEAADGSDDPLLFRSRDSRKGMLRTPFDEKAVGQSRPPA